MRLRFTCKNCVGQDCPTCHGAGHYDKVTNGSYPEFMDNTEEQAIDNAADDSYRINTAPKGWDVIEV